MRKLWILAITAATVVTVSACSESEQEQAKEQADQAMDQAEAAADKAMEKAEQAADKMDDMADETMASDKSGGGKKATASLSPVADSGAKGKVTFSKVADGIQVRGEATGLSEGKHGVHIHQNGDCGDEAQAAGPHLKLSTDSDDQIHGNLGEFTAGGSGEDTELTLLRVPMSEIMGKAVVVHAKGNDPSQPPGGAAGDRIACGVIEKAQPGGSEDSKSAGDSMDSGDSASSEETTASEDAASSGN